MPNVYFAPWVWATDELDSFWTAPGANCIGCVDLRSLPQQAQRGGLPGHGMFSYDSPQVIVGALSLGASMSATVRVADRATIETVLGLTPGAISATRLDNLITELLIEHGDPTGESRHKPLRGSIRTGDRIRLGGFGKVLQRGLTTTVLDNSIAVFREDYELNLTDGMADEVLRKWTGATMLDLWGEATEARADELLSPTRRGRGWELPETTLTDNFNRADDSTGLGTGGSGSWSNVENLLEIAGNRAEENNDNNGSCRLDADLSSADHYAQAELTAVDASDAYSGGVAVRYSASAETYYRGRARRGSDAFRIARVVTGSVTSLVSSGTFPTLPVTLKLVIDGSDLEIFEDATSRATVTDTNITGNVRTGLYLRGTSSDPTNVDDFESSDDLGGDQTIAPSPISMPASVNAPTLSATGAAPISPSAIAMPLSVNSPVLSGTGAASVAPSPLSVVASLVAPVLSASGVIVPGPLSVAMSVNAPSVAPVGAAPISPASITMPVTVNAPALSGSGTATIAPSVLSVIADLVAPVFSGDLASFAPSPVDIPIVIVGPSFSPTGAASIVPGSLSVPVVVNAPTLSGSGVATISPGAITLIYVIIAPTVGGSLGDPLRWGPLIAFVTNDGIAVASVTNNIANAARVTNLGSAVAVVSNLDATLRGFDEGFDKGFG